MAGATTSVYEFDNVIRGQHVYKSAWTPLTDKTCKCILQEDSERDKYAVNNRLYQHQKEDAHIKRDIENKLMYGTILMFIKFNNFGNRRLNGPDIYFIHTAALLVYI